MSVRLDHGKNELEEVHEINVTPFIDVMLVLLIIFMVAAPLATVDIAVDLPSSTAPPQERPPQPIFLTVRPDLSLTIGATAPFVGLFGTVWGIMNSFIGISKSHTTNLAVVAPGIAEALLATAMGLAAAIPAVVIYNVFSRQIAGYRALVGDASAEVMRLVSRDLDQAGATTVAQRKVTLSAAE